MAKAEAIDETDLRIINILLDNSRLSLRKIARKAGVSVATVMNRINALEAEGIIRHYTAAIDYSKLGYDIFAIIDARVSHRQSPEVDKKIRNHPNVEIAINMTGDFDLCMFTRFRTRQELDRFIRWLQTMKVIYRTNTKLVLNTVKDEVMRV